MYAISSYSFAAWLQQQMITDSLVDWATFNP